MQGWTLTCDEELVHEVFHEGVEAAEPAALQSIQNGRLLRVPLQLHGQPHSSRESAQRLLLLLLHAYPARLGLGASAQR
jgi:hypothetical protein